MKEISNPQIELAYNYIRFTNTNIFLTGKAGTGKTTFLQKIKKDSVKRMAIVAPTGVAAINAGGMTIHSLFQLPFGPLVPGKTMQQMQKRKFTKQKIQLLKSLDLLVIDEISMVRADVLDAIDEVLRRYKDYKKPFGGLQLLMVGDLHQLPPVTKPEDWNLLHPHYSTLYFFGSIALQKTNPVSIELKHIYRQSDETFIKLLNKVRNNKMDAEVLALLNSRYQPDFEPTDEDDYITLSSHNNSAQKINKEKLKSLPGKGYKFKARIIDNFPENSYPTDPVLEFKVGTQVMFVKNDVTADKLYYNGKIGKITRINKESVQVFCNDGNTIEVGPVEWTNTKYTLDEKTKEIKEDITGTFSQLPLKLAWAITIHKSQGLTFERAIIDAKAAFAHGQVYVALSRCTSFEGIVLKSKIGTSSIRTDAVVKNYTENADKNAPDEVQFQQSKGAYQQSLVQELFDFDTILHPYNQLARFLLENESSFQGKAIDVLEKMITDSEQTVLAPARKFKSHLPYYFNQEPIVEENKELQERIEKASLYFIDKIEKEQYTIVQNVKILSDNKELKKTAEEKLETLSKAIFVKLACFKASKKGLKTSEFIRTKANADLDFQKKKPSTARKISHEDVAHPILYQQLVQWRSQMVNDHKLIAYQVAPNKTLMEIVEILPTHISVLNKVSGMGLKRIDRFGEAIIEIVKSYCDEHQISPENRNKAIQKITKAKLEKSISDTKQLSFDLYKKGLNIEEIASKRNLASSTIESHLCHFIGLGKLDIFEFVDKKQVKKLQAFYKTHDMDNVSEAKAKFGDTFTYGQLRMVLQYLLYLKK